MKANLLMCACAVCVVLSGCLPTQMLQRGGALNTMSIELDDENIEYQQLTNSFNTKSFGGFVSLPIDGSYSSKTSVVLNNNGTGSKSFVQRPRDFLKAITLLSTTLTLTRFGNSEIDTDNEAVLFLPSLLVGLAINDNLWRPFNQMQAKSASMNNLIEENPGAHFYSFPSSDFTVTSKLFSTSLEGTNSIVAGTISKDLITGTSVNAGDKRSASEAYAERNRSDDSVEKKDKKSNAAPQFFARLGGDLSQLKSAIGDSGLMEYDYARHASMRIGFGLRLPKSNGVEILPELNFARRGIVHNDDYTDVITYAGTSFTARKTVAQKKAFVEARMGLLYAVNAQRNSTSDTYNDGENSELSLGSVWFSADRILVLSESQLDATVGIGLGVMDPSGKIALTVGFDYGLLATIRQAENYDWFLDFENGTEDRFNTINLAATYAF